MDEMTRREALGITIAAGLAAMSEPVVEGMEGAVREHAPVDNPTEQHESSRATPPDEDERICVTITN